jgi:hypothetical protein
VLWLINGLMIVAALPLLVGWAIVAVTSIQLFAMVPKGQRIAAYNDLGMWRFGKLRQRIGPQADPLLRRMKLGGIAFALGLVALLALVALSIPFNEQAPTAETAALFEPVNGVFHA